ncbi:MAG: hypothetical protein HYZ81_22430 [Nitrospinae bacterium]|nr:hypothetical protein [Nitrospinota bacterium]
MSVLLFLCISFFLVLFVVNNAPAVMLTSPLALVLVAMAVAADVYLLRSLVRDWLRQREERT